MKLNNCIKYSSIVIALISTLSAETKQLENISVISASGFEQDILQAPASITVITKEEIENKGYIDIPAVLKDIPGVFIDGGGNARGKGMGGETISIRGMDGSYSLFLVNGKPLSNSSQVIYNGEGTGAEAGFLPPLSAIERVEVIKGPMSSLYGSQAMGGVINIITKKVQNKWGGNLSVDQTIQQESNFGNEQQYKTYLSGPLIKDKLNLTVTGQYTKAEEDKVYNGSKEQDRKSLSSEFTWLIDDNNDLSFKYAHYNQKSEGEERTYTLNNGSTTTIDPSDNEMTNKFIDITHNIIWGDNIKTTSYLQQEDYDAKHASYESQYKSNIFNSKSIIPMEKNILSVGLEYKTEKTMHDPERVQSNVSQLEKWNSSLFAENEYYLNEDFSLTTGLRVNEDENYGQELTPRVYGVYTLNDNFTLKGGVSTGYKTPDLDQASSQFMEGFGGGSGYISGDENLKPEKSTNYEIALVHQGDNNFNFSITAYKTLYKDKINTQITCDETAGDADCVPNGMGLDESKTAMYRYINIDEAELQGFELTTDYTIDKVVLKANYTYNKAEITSGDDKGNPLNNTPKNMFNVGIDWNASNKLKVWNKVKYTGKASEVGRRGTTEYPSYTIIDLGINYKINDDLKVHTNINNLANKEILYEEYYKVLDGRNINIGLNYNF